MGIILPSRRRHHLQPPWSSWDEAAEKGIAGPEYLCFFFENVTGGGNETGQGAGLSGADLVLTDNGGILGASGSPPSRHLQGGGDYFEWTSAGAEAIFCQGDPWTWIYKTHTLVDPPNGTNFVHFKDNLSDHQIKVSYGTDGATSWYAKENGNVRLNSTTTAAVANSGDVWWVMEWDGTTVRGGFKNGGSKPTAWSQMTEFESAVCDLSPIDQLGNVYEIGGDHINGKYVDHYGYYFIAAKGILLTS